MTHAHHFIHVHPADLLRVGARAVVTFLMRDWGGISSNGARSLRRPVLR